MFTDCCTGPLSQVHMPARVSPSGQLSSAVTFALDIQHDVLYLGPILVKFKGQGHTLKFTNKR